MRAGIFIFITLLTYYFLFKYYEARKIGELSLDRLLKDGLYGIVGAVSAISLVILILYLLGYYKILSTNISTFNVAYLLIIITSLAAFEKVLFRGIGYRIVEETLETNLALIIISLLFGLGHIPNDNATVMSVMGTGIGGALVGMMFSMTRRLWLPIFFHGGWNFAQACYGMPISGMKDFLTYSPFQGMLQEPSILTGGSFGLENFIIIVALTIIIFVVLYFWVRKGCYLLNLYWKRKSASE
jgi:hypothetical protein